MGKHAKYPAPLGYYAQLYGRSYETIKAWVHKGKLAGRLPPLESPPEFLHWYQRHVAPALPNDLFTVCSSGSTAAAAVATEPPLSAGDDQQNDGERVQTAPHTAVLDPEQALIELRSILSRGMAELKRAG